MAKKLTDVFVDVSGNEIEVWCDWAIIRIIACMRGVNKVIHARGYAEKYWVYPDPRWDFEELVEDIKALA